MATHGGLQQYTGVYMIYQSSWVYKDLKYYWETNKNLPSTPNSQNWKSNIKICHTTTTDEIPEGDRRLSVSLSIVNFYKNLRLPSNMAYMAKIGHKGKLQFVSMILEGIIGRANLTRAKMIIMLSSDFCITHYIYMINKLLPLDVWSWKP